MSDALLREMEGWQKKEQVLNRFDRFVAATFRVFSSPANRFSGSMPDLRKQILKSNLRVSPEGLLSLAFFATTVTAVVTVSLAIFGMLVLGIVWFLFLPIAIPMVFILVVNLPKASASTRAAAIDAELPFVLGYMSVLAGGGVAPIETLRRVSKMDVLPASSKEAKRLLLQTDVFGADPITAMETEAKQNPSRYWSEFLEGYTAVLKSGGSFENYIQVKLRDLIATRGASNRRSSDFTGTLAEAYLTITVVLGMTLYTLYMTQTMISHNLSGLTNLYFFAFLVVPIISAAFVYLLDSIQVKWPYVDYRPYKLFGIMIPIAAVVFFVPLPLPIYLHMALALCISVGPPAFFATRYTSERRKLEHALPDFIADVTEGRKTGLSPEQSIEALTNRNYGVLSPYVKKMGAQLSWGVALSKVISTFTSSVGSWITRATGILLIEVVDVGGGTAKSFTEMASFARTINDLENERRSALRPFVMITYVAAVMIIMTTFILVYMLTAPGTTGFAGQSIDVGTINLLLATSVFDAFVIGLVAGKMGEGSLADGFKHAFALVIISLIAIFIVGFFIKL
ncbi:MAG: type II secretion system F family protein [Nitrososphaerales archaeon]